jgi:hypothetical protein
MVSEGLSAFTRGRIPAHEFHETMMVSFILLQAKARLSRHQFLMSEYDLKTGLDSITQQSMLHVAARAYISMISDHFMSYDHFSRPCKLYELPQVDSPHTQFSSHGYFELTGFWPEQLKEINQELILLPDVIRCRRTGCCARRDMAIFLLLRRWHIVGNWSAVSRDLRHQCSWCLQIYHEIFHLLASTYRKCVGVLDYRWINPLLEEWGQKLSLHC